MATPENTSAIIHFQFKDGEILNIDAPSLEFALYKFGESFREFPREGSPFMWMTLDASKHWVINLNNVLYVEIK